MRRGALICIRGRWSFSAAAWTTCGRCMSSQAATATATATAENDAQLTNEQVMMHRAAVFEQERQRQVGWASS